MMRKILVLVCLCISFSCFSDATSDEAIILNEELQFLENSAKKSQNTPLAGSLEAKKISRRSEIENESSLEKTYFDDSSEDTVSNRTAAPKRRRE